MTDGHIFLRPTNSEFNKGGGGALYSIFPPNILSITISCNGKFNTRYLAGGACMRSVVEIRWLLCEHTAQGICCSSLGSNRSNALPPLSLNVPIFVVVVVVFTVCCGCCWHCHFHCHLFVLQIERAVSYSRWTSMVMKVKYFCWCLPAFLLNCTFTMLQERNR